MAWTRATALGIAGVLLAAWVASAARAGPCVPPATLDECDLLVVSQPGSVLRYDGATGDFLGEFVTEGSGGLSNPVGIAFGPDDELYVGMNSFGSSAPRVLRYDGDSGAFLDPFTAVSPTGIRFILFGPDGDLYGATGGFDGTAGTVFRADGTTGAFIDTVVDLGLGEGTTGLAFRDGSLYVGSFHANQVLRYDVVASGPFPFVEVFAELPIPAAGAGKAGLLTFGPDGDLYVGVFEGNDVWRFDGTTGDSKGSFIPAADPHPQSPWILVFGPDGNLYVSSGATDEVVRYDGTTGAFIDVFASGGGLDEPTGLAFVPEPGQALLVAAGAAALAAVRRRRTSP